MTSEELSNLVLSKRARRGFKVAAFAVVYKPGGNSEVLVGKRKDGTLGLPGGSIELGETVQEGLAREILEETGSLSSVTGQLAIHNTFVKDGWQWLVLYFYAELTEEPKTIKDESIGDWRWEHKSILQEVLLKDR